MKIEEIWKDAAGYEGLYQVSNLGRIKSYWRGQDRILKQTLDKRGYYGVRLYKNGKGKHLNVHRLVAETFLGKIPKGLVVNHINEIKTDNRLENLEICTIKENINHGTCIVRRSAARRGQQHTTETKQKISTSLKRYFQRQGEA